jgi:HD superfamily phosphohydrolase
MVESIRDIPEIVGLEARRGLVRIPPELDVPLTSRVRRVIDTPAFRRLAHISQLGLVALVYPAAHHRRFEHSLGVYRLGLLYLAHLARDPRFVAVVSPQCAEQLILACLLHDVGHWPFCHLIEDLQLADIPAHETLAREYLVGDELAALIRRDWQTEPDQIAALLEPQASDRSQRLLASILSGPIDVDKMDYLMRDSLHAGVPYGRNFDQTRLIGSLCLNAAGDGLALTDKGRTAAEMMVFARYVMFSEVYWHHAVRAATAMFQRAFFRLRQRVDMPALLRRDEHHFVATLQSAAVGDPAADLLDGLFGTRRKLYKQWLEYSFIEEPDRYRQLTRQPYHRLVNGCVQLAEQLSRRLGHAVLPEHVLIDAPPRKREVQFNVEIYHAKRQQYKPLVQVSPVVKTLAETQFDDYVKRVRLFVHPELAPKLRQLADSHQLVQEAIGLSLQSAEE